MNENRLARIAKLMREEDEIDDCMKKVKKFYQDAAFLAARELVAHYGFRRYRDAMRDLPEPREFRRFEPRTKQSLHFAERQRLAERNRELEAEVRKLRGKVANLEVDLDRVGRESRQYRKDNLRLWLAMRDAGINQNELLEKYHNRPLGKRDEDRNAEG